MKSPAHVEAHPAVGPPGKAGTWLWPIRKSLLLCWRAGEPRTRSCPGGGLGPHPQNHKSAASPGLPVPSWPPEGVSGRAAHRRPAHTALKLRPVLGESGCPATRVASLQDGRQPLTNSCSLRSTSLYPGGLTSGPAKGMSPTPALSLPPPLPQLLRLCSSQHSLLSSFFSVSLSICSLSLTPDFSLCLAHLCLSVPLTPPDTYTSLSFASCHSCSVSLPLTSGPLCVSQWMGLSKSVSLVPPILPPHPSLPGVAKQPLHCHPSLRISLSGSSSPISSLGIYLLCWFKLSRSPNFSPPVTPTPSSVTGLCQPQMENHL